MKWSAVVSVVVVIAVAVSWAILFTSSDERPGMMSSLSGCYLSEGADQIHKVDITASGSFRYRNKSTSVVPNKDKQSLSLRPKLKVVVGPSGELEFLEENPLLLRIDSDSRGFTVPSENGGALTFRKSGC